ncbi:MAG: hypothetical protein WAJ97_15935 [Terriglobales bacterium]|jgi:hypothetical protein
MRLRRQFGTAAALALAAALLVASGTPARAQVLNSAASPIALRAVLSQSLTVTLSGNAVNFNLVSGSANNPGSTSITATTSWILQTPVAIVSLYAFFANAGSALTDGAGDNIPSADFQISDNGGAFTALTNTVPFGGANAGLTLGQTLILLNNRGSRTDVMKFNITLSPLPNLPAGDYTGTLTIQAQAI